MHSRLKGAVQKSFTRILQGPRFLDRSEVEVIDTRDTISLDDKGTNDDILLIPWATRIDRELPWFRKLQNGQFITPQEPIFGYYALRNVLRGLFLGASFLPPGDTLLNRRFLSASIAMYYTASFHFMLAYLSLEGRIVITPVYGPPFIELGETHGSGGHRSIIDGSTAICAILTADGRWIFEGRARTHRAYWAELDRMIVQTQSAPECFVSFARYLTSYGPYQEEYHTELEMVRSALPYLQEARHEAIYQGYGYDPMSADLLTNKDADYAPLDLRAREYQAFSYGLLTHIASETHDLAEHLDSQCASALSTAKLGLRASVVTPPFELRTDIDELLTSSMCNRDDLSHLVKEFLLFDS